jgi:hypothetical protein
MPLFFYLVIRDKTHTLNHFSPLRGLKPRVLFKFNGLLLVLGTEHVCFNYQDFNKFQIFNFKNNLGDLLRKSNRSVISNLS